MIDRVGVKEAIPQSNTLPSALYISPRIPLEEIGRRGENLYAPIRLGMEADHRGQFLSLDVETGEYALGATSREAYSQLLSKKPDAMLYTLRIGYKTAGRL